MGQETSAPANNSRRFQSTPSLFGDSQETKEKKKQLDDEKLGKISFNNPPSDVLDNIERIMDELSVPADKREAIRAMPMDKKLLLLKHHQSNHDLQGDSAVRNLKTPQQYLSARDLIKELLSLEVALRTLPLSWVSDFIYAEGLDVLLRNFRQLCLQTKLDSEEREIQHQYIRCFRTIMNNAIGLTAVMQFPDGITILTLGYDCANIKMKAKMLEILGAVCLVFPNGHQLVVEAFSDYQKYKLEPFRFQTIVNDLRLDDSEFQVVCMALISAIVNSPEEQDFRQMLRFEFLDLGIVDIIQELKETAEEELMRHIVVFEEEAKADFADLMEENPVGDNIDTNDPDDVYATIKAFISDPESYQWMLRTFQKLLSLTMVEDKRKAKLWQYASILVEEIVLQKNGIRLDYHGLNVNIEKMLGSLASQDDYQNIKDENESLQKQLSTFSKDIQEIREILQEKEKVIEELHQTIEKANERTKKAEGDLTGMKHKYDIQWKAYQELKQEKGRSNVKIDLNELILPAGEELSDQTKSLIQAFIQEKLAPKQDFSEYGPSLSNQNTTISVKGDLLDTAQESEDILDAYSEHPPVTEPASINIDYSNAPPPPPPPLAPGAPPPPMFGMAPQGRQRVKTQPSVKMRQMQWGKLNENSLSRTIWNGMDKDDAVEKSLDFNDLESWFGIVEKKKNKKGEKEEKPVLKLINLLDSKKSYNISIMLSRMKFTFSELRVAILQMAEEQLPDQLVKQLSNYIPSAEEQTMLTENLDTYDQLGKPEQFYIEMMKISRYEQRLAALALKRRLPERLEELRPSVECLSNASREVVRSPKFRKLLEVILIIGNFMNAKSFRGNAFGFTIDTLNRLGDVRGNQKGNLLNYLNIIIERKFPDLRGFTQELQSVEKASRLSTVAITQEFTELKVQVQALIEELPRHRSPDEEDDRMYIVMKAFLDVNVPLFNRLESDKNEMEDFFTKALEYYNEDPKTTSEAFFGTFAQFIVSFDKAFKENQFEAELLRKQENHLNIEKKRVAERQQKQQKLLESSRRGVIDELVSSLKTGDFISLAAEERRKNKRISKAIERGDLDAEKLLEELRAYTK